MYKIFQRELRMDEQSEHQLYVYELQFHLELYKYIIYLIEHPKSNCYSNKRIRDVIPIHSKWCLYQIAKRCYSTHQRIGRFQFERSSVWHPRDVIVYGTTIYFQAPHQTIKATMILCDGNDLSFLQYSFTRIDVVHSYHHWYVNFLVQVNE